MIDKSAEIVFNDAVAADIFLMGLHAPDILAKARPGQFLMIRVEPMLDPLLRRPFSICGTLPGGILLVLYKVVGRGTAIMSRAVKGGHLSILGPLGKGFSFPRKNEQPLLIAGGLGLAPILFLAQTLDKTETSLLAGFRSAAEAFPFEKVNIGSVKVVTATDDGSLGYHGFITDLLDVHAGIKTDKSLLMYACGPLPMLKQVAAYALDRNAGCQVSMETHMACGLGACQGCAVKAADPAMTTYHLVCRHGPVFSTRAIDWKAL